MMPWREQLKFGWRILRWIWWPADLPVWVRVCALLIVPVISIGIIRGSLLIVSAGCALTLALAFAHWKDKS